MNVKRFADVASLNADFVEEVVRAVENGARVIELSGGNSPKPVYATLGSGAYRERLARFPVIWIVGDERFVDPDDDRSNRKMIEATLFREGVPEGHRFLVFETRGLEPEQSARAFEDQWTDSRIQGIDVAILGVGDDGHTASLFPGSEVVGVTDRIACATWAAHLDMWRLTLTVPPLHAAKSKLVITSDPKKILQLDRVLAGEDLPIARVAADERSTWYLVEPAGS